MAKNMMLLILMVIVQLTTTTYYFKILKVQVQIYNTKHARHGGSPHEIYNRPANKFVASFVGDSNVMNLSEFDVNKNGKGIVMQYNGGKSFQIDVDESEFCATDVLLIVRPEKAFLTVGIGDAVLKGEIHDISFLGTDTHFRINLSTGKNSPKVFVVRTQNVGYGGCLFSVGDHVGIDFHPQAAQLLLERAS